MKGKYKICNKIITVDGVLKMCYIGAFKPEGYFKAWEEIGLVRETIKEVEEDIKKHKEIMNEL